MPQRKGPSGTAPQVWFTGWETLHVSAVTVVVGLGTYSRGMHSVLLPELPTAECLALLDAEHGRIARHNASCARQLICST